MIETIQGVVRERSVECCVQSSLCLREVFRHMRARDLAAVAVLDGEVVVGVIAGRDIIRRVVLESMNLAKVRARDVMSSPVYWISIDERYEVAKAMMVDHGLRQLVVLDGDQTFRGFVTAIELLQADLENARDLVGKLNDAYYAPTYPPKRIK